MLSRALPMRELHRQKLLAEAAHERRLDQLVPTPPGTTHGLLQHFADLRQGIATALLSLRPARHLASPAITH